MRGIGRPTCRLDFRVVPDPPQEDDGSPGSCALFGTAYHSIYFREPGGVLFKAASDRYDFSTRK